MKLKIKRYHLGLFTLLFSVCISLVSFDFSDQKNTTNSQELVKNMLTSIANIKTLRYHLQCGERIKGKMHHTQSHVKLQVNPRKLYLALNGPELLWAKGENNGNAYVNPGSFPFINLNLDPYGLIMRKDQHHTIHEMGIHYMGDILKDGLLKAGNNVEKHFVLQGEEIYNGRACYRLSIAFSDFLWENYTVKKLETITSIARRLHVSEYMVLEKNTSANWYNDIKEGENILVPTVYAKLTMLLIDKETFLPLSNKVFDDKGLFETYEYVNLQVNPAIAPEEFTKDYKEYHF
jgi:hypothetical protein